jgi:general stress protein 26
MSSTTNLKAKEGVEKLKVMVKDIKICLFCTQLKTNEGATTRPMAAQDVDDDGNIWFFSGKDSDKNAEIKVDKQVQLFFANPGDSSYLVVNGEAEIILNINKMEEIWSPLVKIWFKKGKEDPNLSLIKVNTKSAFYWDVEGSKMINFFKLLASVATGTTFISGSKGNIKV